MSTPSPSSHRESHIFPACAVLALLVMLVFLPQRYAIVPRPIQILLGVALALPMLATGFFPANARAARAERYAVMIVLPIAMCVSLVLLTFLLRDMARPSSGLSGLTLLTTSIGIWVTNVLVFSLAYWQLDRGGPTGRASGWRGRADFTFPRGDPSDGFPADWQPVFADYLALAFNTSAAFSPTDVLPLTPRAKMLMTVQSAISLVTVIAVGARAINILGS
jgi:uncharacterized membrane protein